MAAHSETSNDGDVHAHISPDGMYYAVFAVLTVLTILTWYVARFDFGWLNDPIAIGIAATKTTLVVLFFMHVLWAPKLTKLTVVVAVVWLLIMFGLTMIDYWFRSGIVAEPEAVPPAFEYDQPAPAPEGSHGGDHGEEH